MRIAKLLSLLLVAWIGLAAAFSGCTCVVNNYHYGTVRPSAMYVANGPPAPKEEVQDAAPADGLVWVKGHWEWSVAEEVWIWVGGVWVEPPDDGATWVDPEYEDNNGDWMYAPGYWKWSDTGAPETEEPTTPKLPPGILHWSGGDETAPSDGGETTAPVEPKIPPGTFKTIPEQPEKPILELEQATPQEKEKPPLEVVVPPETVADDPYAEAGGGDGGDQGSKKVKKPGLKELKPKKPEGPDVVEHEAELAKPVVTPAPPEADEDGKPAPKHGKKHKAKSEKKDDDADAAKVKAKDAPKAKGPDKIKTSDKIKTHQ